MIFEAFRKFREETPDAPAFLVSSGDRSVPISWRQFTDDIAAVVWAIGRYCPGATVGILGENSYQWIVAHAACLPSVRVSSTLPTSSMGLWSRTCGGRSGMRSSR